MSIMLASLNFEKRILQKCPLCKQENPIILKGTTKDLQDKDKRVICTDRGYSFCNCNNIYYTDWSNIDQTMYNETYVENYSGLEKAISMYGDAYIPKFKDLQHGNTGKILEVGCINDGFLDYAKQSGYQTYALDIAKRESKHNITFGNFETKVFENRYDIIFASHVFEHFKDPVKAIEKCNHLLNKDGLLFIAMPDPFFIDYSFVYYWDHWHVREHHIMWDMESFIEVVEGHGFKCKLRFRNSGSGEFICWGDFHLIFQKVD